MHPCEDVVAVIAQAVNDDASAMSGHGGVVRPGFSEELDNLRTASRDAKEYIAGLERQERERSGIGSLKVGYNRVFGYYLEVSNSNLARVPEEYIRRQTLVNAERYITPELKEFEALILNAEERLEELESAIFRQVCRQVANEASRILQTATAVAQVDLFRGLAEAASRNGYVRPEFAEDGVLEIAAGRHPVVEHVVGAGAFVPNDTALGQAGASLMVLTGPNMAGKSTYIRQVALIVLMAQVGSFVPADAVRMGIVDRIFTRVGLQDDLATGQSTFMVEMVETAAILHHATAQSLVVLDEIGRGTSTYDGLAIARAVAEYLHSHPRLGCKTLFATHYHELIALADYLPNVVNYNVSAVEADGQVTFLHRIVPGGADRSYGVHVARLAGLPQPLVNRARELLAELEADDVPRRGGRSRASTTPSAQLSLLPPPDDGLRDAVLGLDITEMTPLEALNKLYSLQQQAREAREGSTVGAIRESPAPALALAVATIEHVWEKRKEKAMTQYIPSPADWVREQVELYEGSDGKEGTTLRDTGMPVIIVTNVGNKTGGIRKTPLMRVKDGDNYVLVGSRGGAPKHPVWVYNLRANGDVEIRDMAEVQSMRVREVDDDFYGRSPWKPTHPTRSTRRGRRGRYLCSWRSQRRDIDGRLGSESRQPACRGRITTCRWEDSGARTHGAGGGVARHRVGVGLLFDTGPPPEPTTAVPSATQSVAPVRGPAPTVLPTQVPAASPVRTHTIANPRADTYPRSNARLQLQFLPLRLRQRLHQYPLPPLVQHQLPCQSSFSPIPHPQMRCFWNGR